MFFFISFKQALGPLFQNLLPGCKFPFSVNVFAWTASTLYTRCFVSLISRRRKHISNATKPLPCKLSSLSHFRRVTFTTTLVHIVKTSLFCVCQFLFSPFIFLFYYYLGSLDHPEKLRTYLLYWLFLRLHSRECPLFLVFFFHMGMQFDLISSLKPFLLYSWWAIKAAPIIWVQQRSRLPTYGQEPNATSAFKTMRTTGT